MEVLKKSPQYGKRNGTKPIDLTLGVKNKYLQLMAAINVLVAERLSLCFYL